MLEEANNQELRRFLPIEYRDQIKEQTNYKITAFHELITGFKEISS